MANVKKSNDSGSGAVGFMTPLIIVGCVLVGWIVWRFIMGDGSHFQGNVNTGKPNPNDYLAMVYKGGPIVPILLGCLLMVIVFSIERYMVITKATGTGSLDTFMKKVQSNIAVNDMDAAIDNCDKQKGSVANAIKAALIKHNEVRKEGLDSEAAAESISKEIEEATSLEMPMLEKHMTILSTLVSLGTLAGLLGTVTGMIKAFAGLAGGGGADSAELANGISEALINTATGISTSALAIIMYNLFTSKIDTLTYSIDEAGSAIVKTYRRFKN
jgi:biopolymer transport protein ExbB